MKEHFVSSFQKEDSIRKCSTEEVVQLMQEIAALEGRTFDKHAVEEWFSKSDRFLAAVFCGQIIGTVSYATSGIENIEMPVVDFVNVLRPFKRRGVATRLCIAAIEDLVKDGYTPIHCTTLNPAADQLMASLPDEARKHLSVKKGY